jgi:hypothetical protein
VFLLLIASFCFYPINNTDKGKLDIFSKKTSGLISKLSLISVNPSNQLLVSEAMRVLKQIFAFEKVNKEKQA